MSIGRRWIWCGLAVVVWACAESGPLTTTPAGTSTPTTATGDPAGKTAAAPSPSTAVMPVSPPTQAVTAPAANADVVAMGPVAGMVGSEMGAGADEGKSGEAADSEAADDPAMTSAPPTTSTETMVAGDMAADEQAAMEALEALAEIFPPLSTPETRIPSPDNPAECPDVAPENPVGDCLGLPVYLGCSYGTYNCICDWYHWLCFG